jgi:WD40 repeat protein
VRRENIASGGSDHVVRIWDVDTGKQLRELGVYWGRRDAIAISPDGSLLATEALAHQVEIREFGSGNVIQKFSGNSNVHGLHFSPTGKAVAALFDKWNTIIGWNLESGKVTILCAQFLPVESFVFSQGGLLLATAGSDHSVRIFDATRWRELPLKGAHTAPITAVAFSPDDHTVTTAGRFTPIRNWDVATGKELPRAHQSPARHNAVVFSPDGKLGTSIRRRGRATVGGRDR